MFIVYYYFSCNIITYYNDCCLLYIINSNTMSSVSLSTFSETAFWSGSSRIGDGVLFQLWATTISIISKIYLYFNVYILYIIYIKLMKLKYQTLVTISLLTFTVTVAESGSGIIGTGSFSTAPEIVDIYSFENKHDSLCAYYI
jgi:hypothetical protein